LQQARADRPWDAIVIGARVAGATLAAYLGKAGLRTLLVERARLPAYLPRQGSWERPTEQRWQNLGVWPEIEATGMPARRGYYSATEDVILAYRFPAGDPAAYSRMLRRLVLDEILARFAGSLPTVELRMGTSAVGLLRDGDRVTGVRLAENGREYEERTKLVIGADGRHSWLARQVRAPEYDRVPSPKANFIADYASTNVEPDMSVRVWDRVGSMGMVAMEDGLVTVGMGVWLTEVDAFRAGLPESFETRLRRHPLYDAQIGDGTRVSPIGGAVDLSMVKRTPYGPGWALTGDAGYHLDPLAARGTTAAVLGAELLAEAIQAHLGGDRPEAEAFGRFHAERDRQLQKEWDVTHAAMVRPAPSARDVAEARLLASRPDLLAQHVEVLRGLRDGEAFRKTLDAALGQAV
jgi:2-polyprenyl-6-methoxyphenol hydroxylase-like FAD-dependent oxidoreductase